MEKEIKKISFNILKYDQFSDSPLEIDELTFWKYYLDILQVKAGEFLSEKEARVVAFVLAGVPNRSYFKSPGSKELIEKLGLSVSYLHNIKYSLLEKGIIVPSEIKTDYILNPRLISYQKEIKKHFQKGAEIEYKFKFKKKELDEDENKTQ